MTPGRRYGPQFLPGLVLLFISIVIALCTYQDYGVAWDEPIQRELGLVNHNYIFNGDNTLLHYTDKAYGAWFELLLVKAEQVLHLTDSRDIFLMRHLVTHLFFLFSVFCAYVLIQRLFKNQWLSCIGFIFIAFCPRIYAHSFFNTKDIPFLCIVMVCMLLAQVAFEKNKTWWYAILGAACGLATGTRILGVLLVAVSGSFLVVDLLRAARMKEKAPVAVRNLIAFTFCALVSLYAVWPILWQAPIENFVSNFSYLSHFPWKGELLLNGQVYASSALPWFYLPYWIAVTTPILVLVSGIAGIVLVIVSAARRPQMYLSNTQDRNHLLYLLLVLVPLLSVIILHSVVYDDWRHVYFIYPAFVILGLAGIHKLFSEKKKPFVYGLYTAQIIAGSIFMIRCHPLQQLYFNEFVSHKKEAIRNRYDMDYWGCAYKQGLEYILAHDTASAIKVQWSILPVENNLKMQPADVRQRIQLVGKNDQPDYFITNFRNHPQEYEYPYVFYDIKVLNSTVMRVYKVK